MLKRILLVVLLATLSLAIYQIANADFLKGWKAIRKGKYAFAQQELLPLAEKGDPKAQYAIGIMHRSGKGFAKDEDEANQWFLKAQEGLHKLGEGGDILAQFMLGFLYRKGLGVTQDGEEAAKWYAQAAEAGHRASQYILGSMYHFGRGVPWDEQEAIKWYEKAAAKGHAMAANNIGTIYDNDGMVQVDRVKAYMWYTIAKTLGQNRRGIHKRARKLAIRNLGLRVYAEEMMLGDIEEAKRLANEWLKKHR